MSALFTPIALRALELENRIAISPMCQYRARDGVVAPWHRMHVGMMAISGAGLVIMEATAVEAAGRISHGCVGLYDDRQETQLKELVEQLRTYSRTPLGIQLAHAGRKAATYPILDNRDGLFPPDRRRLGGPLPEKDGWPIVGPSPLAFDPDAGWRVPAELGREQLSDIRDCFAHAARRADRCGLELVEIHGAHGYLLHSFLSERSNSRSDAYGGSRKNRIRYPLEVAEAVRRAFPSGKPVGYRLNGSDWTDGGVTIDDAIALAGGLKEIGIDYVTVSGGGGSPNASYPAAVPGYMVEMAAEVKGATGMTTMAVGMILTGSQAESILASGQADLVAIGRAFIDDPKWGWHAAAELGVQSEAFGLQARVQREKWSGRRYLRRDGEESSGDQI